MDRIVVTGAGLVSPLGVGVETVWRRLVSSQSGIRRLPEDVAPSSAVQIAGQVPSHEDDPEAGFRANEIVPEKDQRKMDRFIVFALGAADEAMAQAGLSSVPEAMKDRFAVIIASGVGGFPKIVEAVKTLEAKGERRLSPFTVPSFLANLAAGQVSIRYQLRGPLGAPVTACAASVQSIGDAVRLIRSGEAEAALAGGSEACIDAVSLGGFAAARALSTGYNDAPETASRPFDAARDGFVMGEGAGMLVIERLDAALARGARPLAEIVGYGTTADAYHMTAGPEDGEGAARAMTLALAQARVDPSAVGYLNAHATSTPVGDRAELNAVRSVFGDAGGLAISSTKSAVGHLLGAAGVAEAIFTLQALKTGLMPPTLNLQTPDPAAEGLDLIGVEARSAPVEYAISNGFGFGGVNASLLLRRWDEAARH